jgi:hypothetical protein
MVYVKYDLRFRIQNGGTAMGSLDFITSDLKEVFDQLYNEVVIESGIIPEDDETGQSAGRVNNIHITITKKRVKAAVAAGHDAS